MCGQFGVDRHMVLPAIQALPRALHLRADPAALSAIPETLKQLRSELDSSRIGNKIIIRHLLSTLFVYVLREWSEATPAESNTWFAAMQNSRIAKALAGIHRSPEKSWTLNTLSQQAGLSRAAFARQFRDSVGETPHGYLTRWRLGIAAQLLAQTSLSVSEVAYRTGYKSEDSFSRAFKAARGMTPAKAREASAGDPPSYLLLD
jgi:AraC family transcriptional activator of mtrCDE